MATTNALELEGSTMSRFTFNSAKAYSPPDSLSVVSGVQLRRSAVPLVAGFMPAGLLSDRFVIPYYDDRTKSGYQRPAQDARVNELATDLRKNRVDLPTAVLLNIRGRDAAGMVVGDKLRLNAPRRGRAGDDDYKFYVVDGQHRVLALMKLIEEFPDEGWETFPLPFICLLGADEFREMEQFHTVNSKAKSVRTDLAQQLLRERAEKDPEYRASLVERGQDWTARAVEIVDLIARQSPVWQGRVRFPAMEKDFTVIPSASMVSSLKPLLATGYFKILTKEQQVLILDAYWRGIRSLLMDAFDTPNEFAIQKGIGVTVLHTVLVQVLEVVRAQGLSVIDPESYVRVLKKSLEDLQGDDQSGRPVSGIDFWRAAPLGAAGSYSSSAGKRVLIAKLHQGLPTVDVK